MNNHDARRHSFRFEAKVKLPNKRNEDISQCSSARLLLLLYFSFGDVISDYTEKVEKRYNMLGVIKKKT